jgi:hypothetical protein
MGSLLDSQTDYTPGQATSAPVSVSDDPQKKTLLDNQTDYGFGADIKNELIGPLGMGFTEGIVTVAGIPVSFTNWIIKQIAPKSIEKYVSSEKPFLGIDYNKDLMRALGMLDNPKTTKIGKTIFGRIVRRIGVEIGANVIPAGLVLKMASKARRLARLSTAPKPPGFLKSVKEGDIVKAGEAIKSKLKNPWDLEHIAANPRSAFVGENVAAAAGGAGAGIAQELAPGNVGAEIGGQIAGSIASGLSPTAQAGRLGKVLAQKGWQRGKALFSEPARAARTNEAVAGALDLKNLLGGPRTKAAIQQGADLEGAIPGLELPLGAKTQSPAIMRTARTLNQAKSGLALDDAARQVEMNRAAVNQYQQANIPESPVIEPGTPQARPIEPSRADEFLLDEAARPSAGTRAEIEAGEASIQGARESAAETIPTIDDHVLFGEKVRDAVRVSRDNASNNMTELANDLGINSSNITGEFSAARGDFFDSIPELFEKKYADLFDLVNNVGIRRQVRTDKFGRAIAAKTKDLDPFVSFQDLKQFRETLGQMWRDSMSGANPNRPRARVVTQIQKKVDDFIEQLSAGGGGNAELAENYKIFRERYRKEFIEIFEDGASQQIRRKGGGSFHITNPEKVAGTFFKAKDESAILSWRRVFGTSKDESMLAIMMDNMAEAVIEKGVVKAGKLTAWKKKYRTIIDRLSEENPLFRKNIESIEAAQDALNGRQAALDVRTKQINDDIFIKDLNKYGLGTKNASQTVQSALDDPRKMDLLLKAVEGSPHGKAALKRNLWDRVAGGTGSEIADFINIHSKVLTKVLGPTHLNALNNLQAVRHIIDQIPIPTGQPLGANPWAKLEEILGSGVNQIASRFFAVKSGRTGWAYTMTDIAGRFFRGYSKREARALFDRALSDPRVAQDILDMLSKKSTQAARAQGARRLGSRMFNLGLTSRAGSDRYMIGQRDLDRYDPSEVEPQPGNGPITTQEEAPPPPQLNIDRRYMP